MVQVLTGEYPLLAERELRVSHRPGGGYDLILSAERFRYMRHLRWLAFSRSYQHLCLPTSRTG
jgi:hypothetical protein